MNSILVYFGWIYYGIGQLNREWDNLNGNYTTARL